MHKCLLCKKELKMNDCGIDNAGEVEIGFGWGSRHDQLGYRGVPNDGTRLMTLLQSTVIRAYICDDCFEQNVDLFKGFNRVHHPVEEVSTTGGE